MKRALILVFCAALCCAHQSAFANSWDYGRFLPASWVEESPKTPSRDKSVLLEQGPYGIPLGADLKALTAWLEAAAVSIENPENNDTGSDIRRVLLEHVVPRPEGEAKEDVASQKETLRTYSFAQIKELLLSLEKNDTVPFNFSPFDFSPLLGKMNSIDIRPTFNFHHKRFSLLDVMGCDVVPLQKKDIRSVCGKLDLRAWQILARPIPGSVMANEGVQQMYIRLYQDDDQRFRVYSCLVTVYAPSRVEILSRIGLLSRKYGEYRVLNPNQLGRQESVLKIRDGADAFPLSLVWGKNLVLFAMGSYAMEGHHLEIANERYQLLYADQGVTDRFLANLDAAIENAPLEEIDHREVERKRVERSF